MAPYPDIRAGMKADAGLLAAMMPLIIVKELTEDRLSTTAFALDAELQFQGVANAKYLVEFNLLPAALSAAGFKTQWSVPLGASGFKNVLGPSSNASNANADQITMRAGVHGYSTSVEYAGVRNSNSSAVTVQEFSVITLGNAGTVGLAWAQVTSNATPSRLFVGSWLRVTRLA